MFNRAVWTGAVPMTELTLVGFLKDLLPSLGLEANVVGNNVVIGLVGEPLIVTAHIDKGSEPRKVSATLENGRVVSLFSYYSDELYFVEEEFIGKTADKARAMHTSKDIAYLQS